MKNTMLTLYTYEKHYVCAGADKRVGRWQGPGSPFGLQLNLFCKTIIITILIFFFLRTPILAPGSSFEFWKDGFVVECRKPPR